MRAGRKIYIVENNGQETSNWSTGTKIYTLFVNALRLAKKNSYSDRNIIVKEYELVPTGRIFNKDGEPME